MTRRSIRLRRLSGGPVPRNGTDVTAVPENGLRRYVQLANDGRLADAYTAVATKFATVGILRRAQSWIAVLYEVSALVGLSRGTESEML